MRRRWIWCRALGPTASRDAEVLSFQSLGSRVLARTGGLAEFTLDGGGKLLTMRLALQELHSRLKVFGRPSQRAAFLRQLTDLTEEFYAYEITPQDLWQQVEDMEGAMGDKLRIWRCCMPPMTGSSMPRAWTPGPGSRSCGTGWRRDDYLRGKDVYLDGFSYLNKLEESVLEQVMRQAESVTVTLLGDRAEGRCFRMPCVSGSGWSGWPAAGDGVRDRGSPARKGPLAHLEKHLLGRICPMRG